MGLSQEIISLLHNQNIPSPDAPKNIFYFVGPYSCGSTTKVNRLKQIFGKRYQYISHEDFTPFLTTKMSVFIKNLLYLQSSWDNLMSAIRTMAITHQNTIFIDCHPVLSVLNCEGMYKSNKRSFISKQELNCIKRIYRAYTEHDGGRFRVV